MFCNYFSDACYAILNPFSLRAQTLSLIANKAAIKNPQNIPRDCTDTLEAHISMAQMTMLTETEFKVDKKAQLLHLPSWFSMLPVASSKHKIQARPTGMASVLHANQKLKGPMLVRDGVPDCGLINVQVF